ncbi:hypothetical protein [Spirillospora sp. NPDC047279]|uniref:hypothetical protein n=1 Tax=Spirillospora sp. NPDC047279 TaxID=3155478 RepID=UPI003400D938
MEELTLRPQTVTRVGWAIGGFVAGQVVGMAPFAYLSGAADGAGLNEVVGLLIALVPSALGAALAVRVFRIAVICGNGEILLRGFLRNRHIPVERIVTIHWQEAKIHWRDGGGEQRVTTVTAFKNRPRTGEAVARAHERSMKQIRDWWRASKQDA